MPRGHFARELVLQTSDGGRVRVGPRSEIRFLRTDGLWTAWIQGRDLRVNAEGAFHRGRPGVEQLAGLRWSEIHGVEVKNLNGAKTYGVVAGSAVIVAMVLVLILGSAKGGGGGGLKLGGLGKGIGRGAGRGLSRGLARGTASAARGMAHAMARGSYNLARAWAHGWRWYGPDLHVNVHVGGPVDPPPPPGTPIGVGDAPPPPPPPSEAAPGGMPPEAPGATPVASGPLTTPRSQTAPRFSRLAVRRSAIRFVASLEGGGDLYYRDGGSFSGYVGIRLADVFELGGGARLLRHRGTETVTPQALRDSWMGFGRLLLHFDVDAARHVALPIGVDVGAGDASIYVRAILGVRVRIWDGLGLGLYPFNPTYTEFKDGDLRRSLGWWSFPTTAEVSYAF